MLGGQLCHYPGCKAKRRSQILPVLLSLAEGVDEFVDVFAGAGGGGSETMSADGGIGVWHIAGEIAARS